MILSTFYLVHHFLSMLSTQRHTFPLDTPVRVQLESQIVNSKQGFKILELKPWVEMKYWVLPLSQYDGVAHDQGRCIDQSMYQHRNLFPAIFMQ